MGRPEKNWAGGIAHVPSRRDGGVKALPSACSFLGILAGSVLLVSAASAQDREASGSRSASPDCSASMRPLPNQDVQILQLACGRTAFLLGPASSYKMFPVRAAGATIVDHYLEEDRRIWMVTIDGDGDPFLEDISGSLAWVAGRRGSSDLTDMAFDLSDLETGGTIHLTTTDQSVAGRAAADGLVGAASVDVTALARTTREVSQGAVLSEEPVDAGEQ